jgi:type III pantothenate kinase
LLLAVDAGNTQTVFGLYRDGELVEHWRVATEAQRTGDELGALIGRFVDLEQVDGVCLSSTVPALVREYEGFAERWAKAQILVVGPGV